MDCLLSNLITIQMNLKFESSVIIISEHQNQLLYFALKSSNSISIDSFQMHKAQRNSSKFWDIFFHPKIVYWWQML